MLNPVEQNGKPTCSFDFMRYRTWLPRQVCFLFLQSSVILLHIHPKTTFPPLNSTEEPLAHHSMPGKTVRDETGRSTTAATSPNPSGTVRS